MRKVLIHLFFLLPASLILLSCGGGNGSSASHTSGIPFRAFVSNSVTAGTSTAGIYIVNAQTDVHPPGLAAITAGNTPGMMVETPNLAQTLVFSGNHTQSSDNSFNVINNTSESNVAHLTLPGYTESFVVSPDSSTAFIALPTAPVVNQSPGKIQLVSLSNGAAAGEIDIPSVHYLSISNSGSHILAFSDNSDSVAVVTPANLGTNFPLVAYVAGFDRPVQAYFSSDDSTAYVVNCGAECGGTQASIQQLNLTNNTLGASVTVPAGTVSLVIGSTMYLAGTPYSSSGPSQPCTGQTTAAKTCGLLSLLNLGTMTVINTTPIVITDGYHNRIAMGPNGQLFIGAKTCTEIIAPLPVQPGAEVRGCLSIYNTLNTTVGTNPAGGVVVAPANGDATGIQPISTRTVVYVVQGGALAIYDATIDALQVPTQTLNYAPDMVGNFIDVKTVN